MGFKCGIVGLPNVGKSTLFNALTETAAAQAANYPFCTIEPNVGEVAVPDPRLDMLAKVGKSAQIIPTRLTFVDIAGLVKGPRRAKALATSSSPPSARWTPSPMWCAASRTATSPMWRARSIRLPTSRPIETELMLARPRLAGEARRCAGEEGQGQRQGSQGTARSGAPRADAAARGQAGASRGAQAGGAGNPSPCSA